MFNLQLLQLFLRSSVNKSPGIPMQILRTCICKWRVKLVLESQFLLDIVWIWLQVCVFQTLFTYVISFIQKYIWMLCVGMENEIINGMYLKLQRLKLILKQFLFSHFFPLRDGGEAPHSNLPFLDLNSSSIGISWNSSLWVHYNSIVLQGLMLLKSEVKLSQCLLWRYMLEVSGQFHALAALHPV